VSGGIAIETGLQFGQGNAFGGDGAQARLKRGMSSAGGDTFSGERRRSPEKVLTSIGIAEREKTRRSNAGNGFLRPCGNATSAFVTVGGCDGTSHAGFAR